MLAPAGLVQVNIDRRVLNAASSRRAGGRSIDMNVMVSSGRIESLGGFGLVGCTTSFEGGPTTIPEGRALDFLGVDDCQVDSRILNSSRAKDQSSGAFFLVANAEMGRQDQLSSHYCNRRLWSNSHVDIEI